MDNSLALPQRAAGAMAYTEFAGEQKESRHVLVLYVRGASAKSQPTSSSQPCEEIKALVPRAPESKGSAPSSLRALRQG